MLLKENLTEKSVNNPFQVWKVMKAILETESEVDQDKEHIWVIGLTTALTIKYIDLVSLGILDGAISTPREIFRFAVMKGVSKIILVHNHPGGTLKPSQADIDLTKRIKQAGDILGIELVDHVIITTESFYSFGKENNL